MAEYPLVFPKSGSHETEPHAAERGRWSVGGSGRPSRACTSGPSATSSELASSSTWHARATAVTATDGQRCCEDRIRLPRDVARLAIAV